MSTMQQMLIHQLLMPGMHFPTWCSCCPCSATVQNLWHVPRYKRSCNARLVANHLRAD